MRRCNEFENKKVITYHGRSFKNFPIKSYYKDSSERYACLYDVDRDVNVQFGGTGVMCIHTSILKIPFSYFKNPNMAPITFCGFEPVPSRRRCRGRRGLEPGGTSGPDRCGCLRRSIERRGVALP